jgi:hypothetical protein
MPPPSPKTLEFKKMMKERAEREKQAENSPTIIQDEIKPIEPVQTPEVIEIPQIDPTYDKVKKKTGAPLKFSDGWYMMFVKQWLNWFKIQTKEIWYKQYCIDRAIEYKRFPPYSETHPDFASYFHQILDIQESRSVNLAITSAKNAQFCLNMLYNTNDWKRNADTVINNEVTGITDSNQDKIRADLEALKKAQSRDRKDVGELLGKTPIENKQE